MLTNFFVKTIHFNDFFSILFLSMQAKQFKIYMKRNNTMKNSFDQRKKKKKKKRKKKYVKIICNNSKML